MNTEQILMCVVALILGMLLANMLKSVSSCKNLIEGQIYHGGICRMRPDFRNTTIDTRFLREDCENQSVQNSAHLCTMTSGCQYCLLNENNTIKTDTCVTGTSVLDNSER